MEYNVLVQKIVEEFPFVDFSTFNFDEEINNILSSCDEQELSVVQKKLTTRVCQFIGNCLNEGCYQIIVDGFLNFDLSKADFRTNLGAIERISHFLDEISFDCSIPNLIEMLDSCDELRILVSNLDSNYDYDNSNIKNMLLANGIVNDINEYNEVLYDDFCISGDENADFLIKNSKYMNLPPLTASEEKKFFERIRSGDTLSRNEFLERNFRLILFFARKKAGLTRLSFIDLFQEGYFGLSEAIDRFDPSMAGKFSTYAAYWINCKIGRAISKYNQVKVPIVTREKIMGDLKNAEGDLYGELKRQPTTGELAERIGISPTKLTDVLNACSNVVSLDTTSECNGNDGSLMNIITDREPSVANIVEDMDKREYIAKVLEEALPERQLEIVKRRFGLDGYEPQTFESIALALGSTKQNVNAILLKGLRKLSVGPYAYLLADLSMYPADARALVDRNRLCGPKVKKLAKDKDNKNC